MATPQRQYKDGLFDVTRTVNSWLRGFAPRLEQVGRELGETEDVAEAKAHYREVERLAGAPTGTVTVKGVYFAASKMNQMLVELEGEALGRREAENENEFWHGLHCANCASVRGESCDCDF